MEGERPVGRPMLRWKDTVRRDVEVVRVCVCVCEKVCASSRMRGSVLYV